MKRDVRLLRRAESDIVGIARYLTRDSPARAEKTIEHILDAIERLGIHPESGPMPREPRLKAAGFRCLTCSPYLIFYKILGRQIRIYRVLHGARSYKALL